jgi:nuclear pore complex protein Nup85
VTFIISVLHVIKQTENGLVEAVAVLISKMPRMRPELQSGKVGECYKAKPDFIKVYLRLLKMNAFS